MARMVLSTRHMTNALEKKRKTLAKYLEVVTLDTYDDLFVDGSEEWRVLTDTEANTAAREAILESVWAFRPEFLAAHTVAGVDAETIRTIQENDKCESNNAVLTRLIDDVDHFVDDAIKADGRGHFLSSYDSEEIELPGNLFAYRVN